MDSVTTVKKISATEAIESINEYFWCGAEYDQISDYLREYFDECFTSLPNFDAMRARLEQAIMDHRPQDWDVNACSLPTITEEVKQHIRNLHEVILQLIDQYLN